MSDWVVDKTEVTEAVAHGEPQPIETPPGGQGCC